MSSTSYQRVKKYRAMRKAEKISNAETLLHVANSRILGDKPGVKNESSEKGRVQYKYVRKSACMISPDREEELSLQKRNALHRPKSTQECKNVNRNINFNSLRQKTRAECSQKRGISDDSSKDSSGDDAMFRPIKRRPAEMLRGLEDMNPGKSSLISTSSSDISSSTESSDENKENSQLLRKSLKFANILTSPQCFDKKNGDKRKSRGRKATMDKSKKPQNDNVKIPIIPSEASKQWTSEIVELIGKTVKAEVEIAIRSIRVDLRRYTEEIKNMIAPAPAALVQRPNLIELQEKLRLIIPVKTLEEFLQYETFLEENAEERAALLNFFRVKMFLLENTKDCVTNVLSSMLSGEVQLLYTAYGRVTKGVGKRSFINTTMWSILKYAIAERLGANFDEKKLQSDLSKWFSQALDRQGGRRKRVYDGRKSRSA